MWWKAFDVTIYSLCSVVMVMKMINFGKQTGLTVQSHFIYIGMAVSGLLLLLNLLHIYFTCFQPSNAALSSIQFSYIIIAALGMLPLVHFMIIKQEIKGQVKPLNMDEKMAESWLEPDNTSGQ
jgi:hypothetical protein